MRKRQLEIVTPCTEDWASMQGTSTVRHCASCSKRVYNVSMLTAREAEAALAVRPDEVCVIYYVDAEGEIVFYPERARPRRYPSRHALAAVTATALVACSQPPALDPESSSTASAHVATKPATVAGIEEKPAASSTAVVPVAAETPAAAKAEDENCDPEWQGKFAEQGRSDEHLRNMRPKPGGIGRRRRTDEPKPLNPYRR